MPSPALWSLSILRKKIKLNFIFQRKRQTVPPPNFYFKNKQTLVFTPQIHGKSSHERITVIHQTFLIVLVMRNWKKEKEGCENVFAVANHARTLTLGLTG